MEPIKLQETFEKKLNNLVKLISLESKKKKKKRGAGEGGGDS